MLNFFILKDEENKILVSYPSEDLFLNTGDSFVFQNVEYEIIHKRFNLDASVMEVFVTKKEK